MRVRLLAGNLSTGNNQSWDPGEGLRILEGLHPDVALLQELNVGDNSDAALTKFAEAAIGPGAYVYREKGAQIPNGVLSRHPITDQGTWADPSVANRGFPWTRIALPGGTDLYAVSVHLLTTSPASRDAEATALVGYLKANVPPGAFIVVGGDLNAATRTEACIGTFSAVLSPSGPYPADANGNDNTSATRKKPHDWLIPDAGFRAKEVPVVIGADTFASGLVFDSRVYDPLADVTPVMMGDCGANGMQHMAVVRDFLLD